MSRKSGKKDIARAYVKSTLQQDIDDVKGTLLEWVEAVKLRNAKKVVSFYASDATLWGTVAHTMSVGLGDIHQYFKGFLHGKRDMNVYDIRGEVFVDGDRAIYSGYYTFSFKGDDDKTVIDIPARFSFIYRKNERTDKWLILHHHSSMMPNGSLIPEPNPKS